MRPIAPFIVIFLACFSCAKGQATIALTFEAELNGGHQPLDSIFIENLTQGGDTTLYGADTVLVLHQSVGTEDAEEGPGGRMVLFPLYPNPVTHEATIRIWLQQDAPVTLRLVDLPGRVLFTYSQLLGPGYHTFNLIPGQEAFFFLVAETQGMRLLQKCMNASPRNRSCRMSYLGHQPGPSGQRQGKSVFPWYPGDTLRFTGFTSSLALSSAIEDDPMVPDLYTFYFYAPCPRTPFVTDYNGNVYNTVMIGTQCWMLENLRARNYDDGTIIPAITGNWEWRDDTLGARCWYCNDSAGYAQTYGALYNWYAVAHPGGLCPAGWHVPTDQEWKTLEMYLGMTQAEADTLTLWRGTLEGGELKEAGLAHWSSPNTGATNASGFSALPGGLRQDINGYYYNAGTYGYWWTATANPYGPLHPHELGAWHRTLGYNSGKTYRGVWYKNNGAYVRCLKN